MQIERKPSRWPYVGSLIALLLFSLSVPHFWNAWEFTSKRERDRSTDSQTTASRNLYQQFWLPATNSLPKSLQAKREPVVSGGHRYDWNDWQSRAIEDLLEILEARSALRAASPDPFAGIEFADSGAWATPLHKESFAASNQKLDRAAPDRTLPIARYLEQGVTMLVDHPADFAAWLAKLPGALDYAAVATEHLTRGADITPEPVLQAPQNAATKRTTRVDSRNPWAAPHGLFTQLDRLSAHPHSARWAKRTHSLLTALTREEQLSPELVSALFRRIADATKDAVQLADEAEDDRLRAELLRAHWSLARRIDCWAVLQDIRVAAIEKRRVAARGDVGAIFAAPPLPDELPAAARHLSANLEQFEDSRDPAIGRAIADSRLLLEQSSDPMERTLSTAVEQHYRNANIRIAITDDMFNRFVRRQQAEDAPVCDQIAGVPVSGTSTTLAESRLILQPDEGRWRMELEADGDVQSRTRSDGGSAQLYSRGSTGFVARKTILVEPEGIRTDQTVVSAINRNRLVGVTTDFDWVPLLGAYARGVALDQYRAKRGRAKSEVEYKVAAQAIEQLDREALDRIDRFESDLRTRFFEPLERSGIAVTAVELTSTTDRVVARLRVAGEHQLAGHTPRPRALADSLASLQLHESALTNAAVAIGLDGQRFTAPQLQQKLCKSFPNLALVAHPDADESTVIQFAGEGAVRTHISNGKFEIALAVDDFVHDGRRIRGFIVHAFYVPAVHGIEVELVREGALGFEGRLSSSERARLHNVFNEVLSEERSFPLIKLEDPADPRLEGLMITQLVLEDGWLGLAVGPEQSGRTAERSRSLR